jgi:glucan-binding YG repeat protein
MALEDVGLKAMRKTEEKSDSSDTKIKSRAGLVINIFAALLAANTFINNGLNSTIMNNTIKANDIWNFYQAKSVKQTMYELAASETKDPALVQKFLAKAASYESDPATGEGKKELFAEAKKLEAERDLAKKKTPWIAYASTAYQLAIVVLSTSILSASVYLFYGSFIFAISGIILMSQGLLLWM